ncbi:MAG: CARDB protein, partial [Candidatus Methanomarinus sp.]
MPVNQTINNVTVVFDNSYTTSINLAEYVSYLLTPDGAEVIPGVEIHGDYPPVNFTYSLVTVPDERLLKIQAIPVKYNIDSQIVELYRSINVTDHTKSFVEENITAKVHIDPSSDYLALHQDENASLIVSLYNDYSATENATDVSVTAEIPDNLEIVSANGTINGIIDGNTVTWEVNNLTTSGINSFKSVELLIQAPASIPDTTIEQINLTATYSNESGGVYEPTEVPIQISLIPPDYVDLTVSNMVIHRPLKLGTPTNVTAVISNDGDINVTYVSVRLLIDGNESSGVIIDTPAMESRSVNLSIGGLTPGKQRIATIVQPIGFETNITNN